MSCRPVCVLLILSLTGLTYSAGVAGRTKREAIHSLVCCLSQSVFLHDRRIPKGQACVRNDLSVVLYSFMAFSSLCFLRLSGCTKTRQAVGHFLYVLVFRWKANTVPSPPFNGEVAFPFFALIPLLFMSSPHWASVWMSHFVPMCKSIVLLDFLHMCVRRVTVKALLRAMEVHLTNHSPLFGSEETRWQKPSWSRSEEVLESNLQLHTVNLIRAWRAQAGPLSISRMPNQRPGWPAPRTEDEVNYEFSIQAEGLICHYRCSTVGIKPAELLGFQS